MDREAQVRAGVTGLALAGVLYLGDAVYFALLLLGPLVTGAVVGARRQHRGWAVLPWVVAGVSLMVYDAVVNREDVLFHAVVTAVTSLMAWGAWALATRLRRPAAVS